MNILNSTVRFPMGRFTMRKRGSLFVTSLSDSAMEGSTKSQIQSIEGDVNVNFSIAGVSHTFPRSSHRLAVRFGLFLSFYTYATILLKLCTVFAFMVSRFFLGGFFFSSVLKRDDRGRSATMSVRRAGPISYAGK